MNETKQCIIHAITFRFYFVTNYTDETVKQQDYVLALNFKFTDVDLEIHFGTRFLISSPPCFPAATISLVGSSCSHCS